MNCREHYAPAWPAGRFDTILCHSMLNVLLPEEQVQVLMAVAELLEPAGRAYFTVRRDIKRAGFRSHTAYDGVTIYQCNVVLPYRSVLAVEHCEIYEYRHFTQLAHAGPDDCPFCHPTADRELLSESATVYALLDGAAGGAVRALIVPKAHIASYFELPEKLRTACWLMVDRVRGLLEARGGVADRGGGGRCGDACACRAGRAGGRSVTQGAQGLIWRCGLEITGFDAEAQRCRGSQRQHNNEAGLFSAFFSVPLRLCVKDANYQTDSGVQGLCGLVAWCEGRACRERGSAGLTRRHEGAKGVFDSSQCLGNRRRCQPLC